MLGTPINIWEDWKYGNTAALDVLSWSQSHADTFEGIGIRLRHLAGSNTTKSFKSFGALVLWCLSFLADRAGVGQRV